MTKYELEIVASTKENVEQCEANLKFKTVTKILLAGVTSSKL